MKARYLFIYAHHIVITM